MFQLYKQRNFNALINDTFVFLKAGGKNYFSTYLTVIGPLVLLIMVLLFVVARVFFESMFSGFGSPEAAQMLQDYFSNNVGLFIGGGFLALLLVIVLSLLNFSFPVLYLSLLEHVEKPTSQMLLSRIKASAGRIIVFTLLSLITFLPLFVILGVISGLLLITIIGIPVSVGIMAAVTCWFFLSFYDYLTSKVGYFTAMQNGFKMLFSNFWPHMGTTAIFWLLTFAIQMIISLITSTISSVLFTVSNGPDMSGNIVITVVLFVLSIAISYFFSNIVMLAHGMIYYSCKEQTENKTLYSEIDQIGNDSE